ncbi:MAG: LLM class F420-dependent oxidoreductase [Chloroflexota bacterium]|nr:LLM class F420-dependent oxidoreductase [Chloroflexota bacterium]
MIEVAIMIEGQDGLTWPRWKRIARAVEDLGFAGLYRSDHFTNANPPDKASLELWVSLTWLASHTDRIEFGPLVTPVSFRHPVWTARIGKDVDDLSGGRLILGVGAGWQEREHEKFGFPLLEVSERLDRFEEGLEVIYRLLHSDDPVDFDGEYYELDEAILLPRPQRPNGPPILVGGNGRNRTLPLAAHYADEWNGVFLTAAAYKDLNKHLNRLLQAEGRDPNEVRRSLMTEVIFGRNDAEVRERLAQRTPNNTADDLRQQGRLVGTPNEIVDQLGTLAEAGVQRIMLQWLALDDLEGLESLATSVLPQV